MLRLYKNKFDVSCGIGISLNVEDWNQELQLTNQMEIIGGGVGTWIVCVVVGAAVYKMLYSSSGRISIPRLVSIEWR